MRQLYSVQLLTSTAASTVLVVRDFDRLRRLIDNLMGIYNFVGVVLTIIVEVDYAMSTYIVDIIKLSTATVADVFLDLLVVRYFGNRLCGVMLLPIVVVNRLSRL